jgi:hypothetical protein
VKEFWGKVRCWFSFHDTEVKVKVFGFKPAWLYAQCRRCGWEWERIYPLRHLWH